jgi:hypothetical protein
LGVNIDFMSNPANAAQIAALKAANQTLQQQMNQMPPAQHNTPAFMSLQSQLNNNLQRIAALQAGGH